MGSSASTAQLTAAEGTIRKLQAELKSVSGVVRSKEGSLASLTNELAQAKQEHRTLTEKTKDLEAKATASQQLPRLEAALKAMKQEAEDERAKLRTVETELKRTRDELEKAAGDFKFENPKEKMQHVAELVMELEGENHPIYGELLKDLGHKKIYLANARSVWAATQCWEKQRAFREERAHMIAAAKKESKVPGWPGTISVVAPQNAVVDGQHRLGAAWLLSQQDHKGGLLDDILVEVYDDAPESALFAEINKAEPVPLIDLPDEDGGASNDARRAIDHAADALKQDFPDMFKPSRHCRPPHLNVDVLRDELHKAGLSENVDAFLRAQNDKLAALTDDQWHSPSLRLLSTSKDTTKKALAKARKFNFFLGLTWEWLHNKDLLQ